MIMQCIQELALGNRINSFRYLLQDLDEYETELY